jgi:hypothetical protein
MREPEYDVNIEFKEKEINLSFKYIAFIISLTSFFNSLIPILLSVHSLA